jgi:acyl carrier protein
LQADILTLVYAAIDEVNAQAADGVPIEKKPEAPLLGSDRGVDSLTFVNLVIAVEEQLHSTLKKSIVLVDENSMALQDHPFRTVGTLASYVEKILGKAQAN